MTEKRYIVDVDEAIIDTKTNREYTTWDISGVEDICDLLNDLNDENEQLKFENNELKCALALDSIDYIIADGKKIDIPPYYEFENRYKNKKYRREEYDEYW